MKRQILEDLTKNDCTSAIILATELYNSKYSDNDIRMLYASAMGCNIGINLYTIISQLANFGSSANPIAEFARMFPSTSADSKMESSFYALDALQAIVIPGSVIGTGDQTHSDSYNIGSVLTRDRTADANVYLMFVGMSVIGTTLNRHGDPDAGYAQGTDLPWESAAAVQADATGAACALAAGFLNFFDGADIAQSYLGSNASGISDVLSDLQSPITEDVSVVPIIGRPNYGGLARCAADGYTTECEPALTRLRFRGACNESGPIASVAAGIIGAVNDLWQ